MEAAVRELAAQMEHHRSSIEARLDQMAVMQADMRGDIALATAEARTAKEYAQEAARLGKITNGAVTALQLWRAAIEGGGRVLNIQVGLLFGSGVPDGALATGEADAISAGCC